jgi:hypothetical protein
MANTILDHQMIARAAAEMLEEKMCFINNINRERESEFGVDVNGYQKGSSVKVKIPPNSKVYDGNIFAGGGSADDQDETYKTLTVSTQKHVPLRFTALEKAMDLTNYKERFLEPALSTLASVVQADFLTKAYKQVPGLVGTAGAVPTTMKTYAQAGGRLNAGLCPASPRTLLFSDDANIELVDASKVLFNPTTDIAKMYRDGIQGYSQGFEFYTCQSMPTHTNGTCASGATIKGASQTGTSLAVNCTNADTFTAGTVFTIDGVYAVHPLTGIAYPHLRQFVITAAVTATTSNATWTISPEINATAPGKTVNALPGNTAAIHFVGSNATGYRQNLAFQRDAFATAFVPLKVLASCEGYTYKTQNFAVRIMTGGDFTNDAENTRIDVLYADPVLIRYDHACRITE